MTSQYIKRDRSRIYYTKIPFYMVFRIGGFLDIFKNALFWLLCECLTARFTISQIWLDGRVKEIKMSAYFFGFFLKSSRSRILRWKDELIKWHFEISLLTTLFRSTEATRYLYRKRKKVSTTILFVNRTKSFPSPEVVYYAQTLEQMQGRYSLFTTLFIKCKMR